MDQETSAPLRQQVVFLGSSKETIGLTRQIALGFRTYEKLIATDAWYDFGTWSPGAGTLEALEPRLRACDFAVFVLSGEDRIQSRNDPPRPAPRDNVLFELGLSMGYLGRNRAFFCFPQSMPGTDFKLPSDLFGVTAIPFRSDDTNEIMNICTEIAAQIEKLARKKIADGLCPRPEIRLSVSFPNENNRIVADNKHISGSTVSTLKINAIIRDNTIDDVRCYFDDSLNMSRDTWIYRQDNDGLFYDATEFQRKDMIQKPAGCNLSFGIQYPRRGEHHVKVVALSRGERKYIEKFVLIVD